MVDDVEMRQMIEGRGHVPGQMKKALVELDRQLIKKQHSEQMRHIQDTLDMIPRNVDEGDMEDVPAWTESDSHAHEALGQFGVTGSHFSHSINKLVHHSGEKATKMKNPRKISVDTDSVVSEEQSVTPSRMMLDGKVSFFDVAKTALTQDLMYKNEFTTKTCPLKSRLKWRLRIVWAR